MTNTNIIPAIRPHHHLWFRNAMQRYELAFVESSRDSHRLDKKYNSAQKIENLIHGDSHASHEKLAQLWLHLEKIHLHATSGKLISHPGFCLNLDLAVKTLSCQQAKKVVSKKAVSGFQLAKNTVLAVKTTLRGHMMNQFCYKWYFISAQQDYVPVNKKTYEQNTIKAINDVFLFHELDRLDYDLFSKVNGFEIVFKEKTKKLT